MNTKTQIGNSYTDAPEPHPNFILGSLHLVFWAIFHPSAWCNYVARIDPTLRPDFTLIELHGRYWHDAIVRRLLLQGYLVLPLLAGLVVGPALWLGVVPIESVVATTLHYVMIVLIMGIFFSLVVSFAAGITGGLMVGLMVGLAGSMNIDVVLKSVMINLAIGTFIGLVGSVNSNLPDGQQTHSSTRQMGGIIIGILIGVTISLTRYGLTVLGEANGLDSDTAYILARSLMIGVSFGLAIGWRHGLVVGLVGGVVSGLLYHFAYVRQGHVIQEIWGIVGGIVFGMSLTSTFAMPFVLANHIAGAWAGAWAGALSSYGRHIIFDAAIRKNVPVWPIMPVGFLGVILGLTQVWWRPLLCYPLVTAWNLLLYRADERRLSQKRRSLLRWHSAFWDEDQFLRLPGLDDHLLLVMEHDLAEGQAAIDYLATGRQRWAVHAVQIELDARQLAQCAGVMAIRKIHRSLMPGELTDTKIAALLRNFSRISRDVDAALNQNSAYNQRQALSGVEERLDGLLRDLNRSSESYVVRFRPIVLRWRQIVSDRVQELTEVTKTLQEINSPYVIGMPLMEQQEVFVGRTDISDNIEQFLLDHLCPPLLLYGQRRMGKTSLLNNLGRLLPSTILPLFVDLQGPTSWSTDHAGFLYGIAQNMIASAERQRGSVLPSLAREDLTVDPFIYFDQWLNKVEQTLESYEFKRVVLALDEFEALDDALNEGRFNERAVLGMLRHLIQHRPLFKILLAGSHTLEEFQRWSSYLINVRLIHLSYLNEAESRQLIERPIEDFTLSYEPEASQRVLELTRGHPFLIQLLCNEIVALKNRQDPAVRRLACLVDVELAVEKALDHGGLYFADIYHNQIDRTGLAILSLLAVQGEGAILDRDTLSSGLASSIDLDAALPLLIHRELIEAADEGYRFQVELIRRWFAQVAR